MVSDDEIIPVNAPRRAALPLRPGDPAPWFRAPSDVKARFDFSSLGGLRLVVAFIDSLKSTAGAELAEALLKGEHRFDARASGLVLITGDASDMDAKVPDSVTGVRYLFDPDHAIARLYGAATDDGAYKPMIFILDERLRVLAAAHVEDPVNQAAEAFDNFDRLAPMPPATRSFPQAPVLIIPHVFEPGLCRKLIERYEADGGAPTGFMVVRNGKTIEEHDPLRKQRSDWIIEDSDLLTACRTRVSRRIVPEVQRAFQFMATRIERYLVACYSAENAGHFSPHRDNTTPGTAHRRFAVSVNLNSDYDGGDLVFPEFGRAHFRPPAGGACVFSCSLLHEATTVTKGKRYVFVPFLYDEPALAIRQQNAASLDPGE